MWTARLCAPASELIPALLDADEECRGASGEVGWRDGCCQETPGSLDGPALLPLGENCSPLPLELTCEALCSGECRSLPAESSAGWENGCQHGCAAGSCKYLQASQAALICRQAERWTEAHRALEQAHAPCRGPARQLRTVRSSVTHHRPTDADCPAGTPARRCVAVDPDQAERRRGRPSSSWRLKRLGLGSGDGSRLKAVRQAGTDQPRREAVWGKQPSSRAAKLCADVEGVKQEATPSDRST
jgi:hypothetical protein